MNRFSRFFSALASLALILAAPGLAPYQAAAQTMAARAVVPVGQLGVAGASINGLGAAGFVLPAASLQAGLTPALSPSAAPAPVLSAPSAPAPVLAAPAAPTAAAIAPAAATRPLALKAARTAAATAEKSAAPARALAALQTGANALGANALGAGRLLTNSGSGASSPYGSVAVLDAMFEGSIARPEALAVSALPAASAAPRLDPSEARAPQAGPRWVTTLRGPDDAPPATSVKRTLSVGFLAAVIPIAITMASIAVAQLLGYHLHPNYNGPAGTATTSLLQALAIWAGAAIMAPLSEEAIFRGGLQGRLAKLSAKLHLGSFVVPALITSVLFVALHETSDPLLFATRMVHAMVLSYVYHKEGILASMAAHGFFNGLLALSIVFSAIGMPWLSVATVPLALFFAWRAAKAVRAQKPAIASGALAPKPLSAGLSFLFAGLLMLGYFFLMPNIFWPIGAAALVNKGILMLKKKS
jgi:membrane protease YdiL (CAAX protease family)